MKHKFILQLLSVSSAILLGLPAIALAHGAVDRTNPADGSENAVSPSVVDVWFDEALVPDTGMVSVINSRGDRVDTGETWHSEEDAFLIHTRLLPNLPDGTYIISASATVVSDGHTATGSTVFWVGEKVVGDAATATNAAATPAPDYSLVLVFLSLMLGAGIVGYWAFYRQEAPLEVQSSDASIGSYSLD